MGGVVSGALLGASLGVGEFNDRTSPLISNIVGIISAVFIFLSMVVLYSFSENSGIAFIVLGLILAGAFYYGMTRG